MQANNTIIIVGRVGADPEVKYIDANKVVAKINVAVNRPVKDQSGNYITDWFSCEFWNKQADLVGELVKKGTLISVVGSARIEKWQSNGETKSRFLIAGNSFQLLSSKSDSNQGNYQQPKQAPRPQPVINDDLDDDVPPF